MTSFCQIDQPSRPFNRESGVILQQPLVSLCSKLYLRTNQLSCALGPKSITSNSFLQIGTRLVQNNNPSITRVESFINCAAWQCKRRRLTRDHYPHTSTTGVSFHTTKLPEQRLAHNIVLVPSNNRVCNRESNITLHTS
jgi:hypothetical protein